MKTMPYQNSALDAISDDMGEWEQLQFGFK